MSIAFLLSALLACSATSPAHLELTSPTAANHLNACPNDAVQIVASSPRSGRKGPGPDHGDDPHDEHSQDLPFGGPDPNHYGKDYPSRDPYGDTVPNGRRPYLAPNTTASALSS